LYHDVFLETCRVCYSCEPFELVQHVGCRGSQECQVAEVLGEGLWSHLLPGMCEALCELAKLKVAGQRRRRLVGSQGIVAVIELVRR
jgi:hypothetical protein